MGSESSDLGRNSFVEASISCKSVDVMVEDHVIFSVVPGLGHLLGRGKSNSVDDSMSETSSGGLNSWGGVLGVGEPGVTRGHGVMLTS